MRVIVVSLVAVLAGASVWARPAPRYPVDLNAEAKLYTTGSVVRVFDAPKADAKLLRAYPARAIMALLGTATGTDYVWVSPCNACEPGYALRAEFFKDSFIGSAANRGGAK